MAPAIDFVWPVSNENNSNHNGSGIHKEQECNTGVSPLSIPPDLTRLSDGSRVEWVRDRANPSQLRLLLWKDGRAAIQHEVSDQQQILRVPKVSRRLAEALYLPADLAPGGSSSERVNEIASVLRRHIPMAEQDYFLASSFALSTWFPERISVFPYLFITGPTGSGKTPLLKLLQCFCRRALLLGDTSTSALYRIADRIRPTLLLDECEFEGSQRRFLRVGNVAGEFIARGDELFDSSCPKIFGMNEAIDDIALSTRGLHISMFPDSGALPHLDQDSLGRIAAEQQGKMLGFRFENIDRVCGLPEDLAEKIGALSPKMRNIARALMVPLLGDRRLESQLISALQEQNEGAVVERSGEPDWFVVKALLRYYHLPQAGEVTVGEIAEKVNRIRDEAGLGPVSARKVGATLNRLGIKTKDLGSWGRGIELTPEIRRKVHALARQFGITLADVTNWMAVKGGYGGPFCRLCKEFGLTAGLRFSPPLPRPRHNIAPLFSPSGGNERPERGAGEFGDLIPE